MPGTCLLETLQTFPFSTVPGSVRAFLIHASTREQVGEGFISVAKIRNMLLQLHCCDLVEVLGEGIPIWLPRKWRGVCRRTHRAPLRRGRWGGRTHYAEIGTLGANGEAPVRNTILELRSRVAEPRAIDRTIAEIATRHGGIYSDRLHREFDSQASGEFVGSHVRRLEATRREGMVSRLADGSWSVGRDYLDRALRYEQLQESRTPVRVAVLSWQRLEDLPQALGATWLDRKLIGKEPDGGVSTRFGAEVETALRSRRQWLIEQGLAREEGSQMRIARNMLEARELARTAAEISVRTGLAHVDGIYRRSGRFALIERSHDFVLVPWRPVLERARGQLVTGQVGGEGISWSIGIKRGIGPLEHIRR